MLLVSVILFFESLFRAMTIGEGRDIDGQVNHDFTFMLDPLFTKQTDAASASLHPCPQSPAALTGEKHPEIPKLLHLVQQLVPDPEWTCHLFPAEDHSFRPGGDVNYHSAVSLEPPPDVTNIITSSTKTRDELLRTPKCKTFMTWLKKKPNLQCGTIMTRDNLLSAGLWFF